MTIKGLASGQLDGAHLRIVTVEQPPFIYYDDTQTGNSRWTGYLIDFWELLLADVGQNVSYTFYNSPDGRFGGLVNGNWNGMTKEILEGNADLALADFTITALRYRLVTANLTSYRSTVTAWTVSFENVGLALMVPARSVSSNFWKFLNPFTAGLWLALISVSIGVSVFLWISDRMSPYGWSKQARRKDRNNLSTFLVRQSAQSHRLSQLAPCVTASLPWERQHGAGQELGHKNIAACLHWFCTDCSSQLHC